MNRVKVHGVFTSLRELSESAPTFQFHWFQRGDSGAIVALSCRSELTRQGISLP